MKVRWLSGAAEDRDHWATADPRVARRLEELVGAIARDPFRGMGKPEPLRGPLSGWWSRRITREHRLVYRVERGEVWILQARYHY
ncbi:MAG: Txe/YoeB family addiction module toxin [Opitutia bacterium]|jgi:toxin YoeB